MASQVKSTKHLKKNISPSLSITKVEEEGMHPSILRRQHHHDTKTRQASQKGELQANITDYHRCKNPQQSISEQNSTIH